jgi:hypothetical protein
MATASFAGTSLGEEVSALGASPTRPPVGLAQPTLMSSPIKASFGYGGMDGIFWNEL